MPDYRIRYSKKGAAKYISHLDLLRTFERAGRRARLPLAFTKGFNPHPKISFAAPLSVGIAGEQEFADIELLEFISVEDLRRNLSLALPEGLEVLEARILNEVTSSLMAKVDRAVYRAEGEVSHRLNQERIEEVIGSFLDSSELWVERQGKKGAIRRQNIREGIFSMTGSMQDHLLVLEMELKAGSSGNVRCEDVLESFCYTGAIPLKGRFTLSRLGLYGKPGVNIKENKLLW